MSVFVQARAVFFGGSYGKRSNGNKIILFGKDSFVGIELRVRFKCKMEASPKCESLAYHE